MWEIMSYFAKVQTPDGIITKNLDMTTFGNIMMLVFALAGAIAVAFIVWGGIRYIISQGEAGDVKQAKDTIFYAIIGLVLVIISFSIMRFIIGIF